MRKNVFNEVKKEKVIKIDYRILKELWEVEHEWDASVKILDDRIIVGNYDEEHNLGRELIMEFDRIEFNEVTIKHYDCVRGDDGIYRDYLIETGCYNLDTDIDLIIECIQMYE